MQASKSPDTSALILKERTLTYAELNRRANHLAWHLFECGVRPEVTVGICAERSFEAIVGLLGILKAGGTCLPLDPEYPKDRLAFMLEDGNVQFTLADGQFLQRLPERQAKIIRLDNTFESVGASSKGPSPCINQENLAYVIYTSGSTGKPKGVEVTHRGIVKLLFGSKYVNLDETKTILQLSALTFDGSIFEIWGALLNGGRCVLYPGRVPMIGELGVLLRKHRVTTASLTPSLFNAIVDEDPAVFASLEQIALGGEASSVSHIRRACNCLPNVQIINCYGPTEATVDACSFVIGASPDESATSIPIGRPIENTRAHVLDPNLRPVPVGVAGELYLGGDRLARGYRNRPELTAKRFIPDPFIRDPKARLFKTGDLARFRADGDIDFLGRIDDQVKVRGYRIELGEIEAGLRRHLAVRDAVVLVDENPRREKRLSVFAIRKPKIKLSADELRQFLRRELPEFMVPSFICVLDQWPLTSSSKVDRQALATLRATNNKTSSETMPPRTNLEKELVRIWEQILECGPIGIRDNFFDLGGNSLLTVRLHAQIEAVFDRRLPIASLLGAATIEQLAGVILQEESHDRLAYAVPIQSKGDKPIFFCVGAGPLLLPLSEQLGSDQPFFSVGLRAEAIEQFKAPYRIQELAQHVVSALREKQPEGPYYLGGFCDDGVFAFEMARQLTAQGQSVGLLVLFEARNPFPDFRNRIATGLRRIAIRLGYRASQIFRSKISDIPSYIRDRGMEFNLLITRMLWRVSPLIHRVKRMPNPVDMEEILFLAMSAYKPRPLDCPTVLFRGKEWPIASAGDPYFGWRRLLMGDSETYEVPGDHTGIFSEPNVKVLAAQLRECLLTTKQVGRGDHMSAA